MAYAFLTTYQAYYLLDKIRTAKADVPEQIFLGTLAQAAAVDLALVVDVLPDKQHVAKGLGVLYMVAGLCAITGAAAILPVRRVR